MNSSVLFQVSAHLNLKGLIDPAKEIEKLEKKKSTLNSQIDKLMKLCSIKGALTYKESVCISNTYGEFFRFTLAPYIGSIQQMKRHSLPCINTMIPC